MSPRVIVAVLFVFACVATPVLGAGPMAGEGDGTRSVPATATDAELLAEARDAFAAGRHRRAAELFDKLERRGAANGEFYLSQGNAHQLAGQWGRAILAYRRAERLRPNDARVRENLAEARSRALGKPVEPNGSWNWVPRLSRPMQIRVALVAFAFAWLFVGMVVARGGGQAWLAAASCFLLSLLLGGQAYFEERDEQRRPLAVIVVDSAPLRRGNSEKYAAVEVNRVPVQLRNGTEARARLRRSNGWVQIELPDGLVGWVAPEHVLLDREPE